MKEMLNVKYSFASVPVLIWLRCFFVLAYYVWNRHRLNNKKICTLIRALPCARLLRYFFSLFCLFDYLVVSSLLPLYTVNKDEYEYIIMVALL